MSSVSYSQHKQAVDNLTLLYGLRKVFHYFLHTYKMNALMYHTRHEVYRSVPCPAFEDALKSDIC
jgi:hypothetical protein